MHQPLGFVNKAVPHHVCKLHKTINGLKQTPRAWNARFTKFVYNLGFSMCKSDTSLFVYMKDCHLAYLLLYVDDIHWIHQRTDRLYHHRFEKRIPDD